MPSAMKTGVVELEKGEVAIVLTPIPAEQIRFHLYRNLEEDEEPTGELMFVTGVALGLVSCAVHAPDLVYFMSEHGLENSERNTPEEPAPPKKPPLSLATLDGETYTKEEPNGDNQDGSNKVSTKAGDNNKIHPEGTGGYTRDITEDPPDESA